MLSRNLPRTGQNQEIPQSGFEPNEFRSGTLPSCLITVRITFSVQGCNYFGTSGTVICSLNTRQCLLVSYWRPLSKSSAFKVKLLFPWICLHQKYGFDIYISRTTHATFAKAYKHTEKSKKKKEHNSDDIDKFYGICSEGRKQKFLL